MINKWLWPVLVLVWVLCCAIGWDSAPAGVQLAVAGWIIGAVIAVAGTIITAAVSSSDTDKAIASSKRQAAASQAERERQRRAELKQQRLDASIGKRQLDLNERIMKQNELSRKREREDAERQRRARASRRVTSGFSPAIEDMAQEQAKREQQVQRWGV